MGILERGAIVCIGALIVIAAPIAAKGLPGASAYAAYSCTVRLTNKNLRVLFKRKRAGPFPAQRSSTGVSFRYRNIEIQLRSRGRVFVRGEGGTVRFGSHTCNTDKARRAIAG